MKKTVAVILCCLLVLLLAGGALLAFSYYNTTEQDVPQVRITALGQPLEAGSHSWNIPILGGLVKKNFAGSAEPVPQHLGVLPDASLPLVLPEGYVSTMALAKDGLATWQGGGAEWNDSLVSSPGEYQLDITCQSLYLDSASPYGWFSFRLLFEVEAPEPQEPPEVPVPSEPEFITGPSTLYQGDAFALKVAYLPDGTVPALTTNLLATRFTKEADGSYLAFIPLSYSTDPGDYSVAVTAGEYKWSATITVLKTDFPQQNLTIDTSAPGVAAASTTQAYEAFNNTMASLYLIVDEERYWSGSFIQPAQGRISTEYATSRFTNGQLTSRPHAGMDFAAPENSDVLAGAAGRVVFSGFLDTSGWTVVIEHGGGLKSLYFHMNKTLVSKGDMVEQGQQIGLVGMTGYSTGPHLHFEVRVGNKTLNPWLLITGESSLLYFDE